MFDRQTGANQAALLYHHPFYPEVADFTFYQQEVLSPETREQIEKCCIEPEWEQLSDMVKGYDEKTVLLIPNLLKKGRMMMVEKIYL